LNKKRTPQELLSRPPPKFVHDVAVLVRQVTGFLPALSDIWPDGREEKLDLLQHISDTCAAAMGMDSVDFDPADVLKGKEVEKTLRLLQLIAVGASRDKHGTAGMGVEGTSSAKGKKGEGLTSAGEMPRVLDTIARCMQRAADVHDQQRSVEQRTSAASPTRELENSFTEVQERLAEETQMRVKQEQRLAELQKELDASRGVLSERHVQLDHSRQVAGEKVGKKDDLRRQVDQLRSGLLERAKEMSGNAEVTRKRKELEEVARLQSIGRQAKEEIASNVKKLTQQRLEADTQRETLELEVKRMKLRMAEGLDASANNAKVHQTEEILGLQAEKQKLDVRLGTLEEKLRNIAESDDLERQRETGLLEDNKIQSSRNDDSQMQLQVVIEERDALRDGMDQLWQEKICADEELDGVTEGYTHLSDRLLEKSEEARELEEKSQEYDNLLSMLQENYEKNRHSPVNPEPVSPVLPVSAAPAIAPEEQSEPQAAAAHPDAVVPTKENGDARAKENGNAGDEDGGSSHYSEEEFEEYNED